METRMNEGQQQVQWLQHTTTGLVAAREEFGVDA
jgi:hypothetical protein